MKGTLVFVQAKTGKNGPYTRVGVVPEGKKDAIFFNVDGALDLTKGAAVEFDPKTRSLAPLNGQETAPLAVKEPEGTARDNPRPYINRSVALQCATQLLAAQITAGLVPMEAAEKEAIRMAQAFETYLNGTG